MNAVVKLERPISGLAAALAEAQLEIQNPPLDATNPHFKSKFASLPGVRNAIVPIMAKYGIAVTQDLKSSPGGVSCTTVLTHSSGEQMVFGPLDMPATKQDAQGLGSAATYARRYGLLAAACVAGEQDDDGNAATDKYAKIAPKRMRKIVDGALKATADNNGPALLEIWDELESDEKLTVWGELRSWERSSIKDLLNRAKAPDAGVGLDGWSIQLLRSCKTSVELDGAWRKIQDAFAENDSEVPLDVQTIRNDCMREMGV
jgi:hypothetical protein